MDSGSVECELRSSLSCYKVDKNLLNDSINASRIRKKTILHILEHGRIPDLGISSELIKDLLDHLSEMDGNNFQKSVGLGEREGRVFSGLVKDRNLRFSHGIGRSGDLCEVQPKAIGSSILQQLCHRLIHHLCVLSGYIKKDELKVLLLPVATGMALMLSFLSLKKSRPKNANYILWFRIDQKSCFKSITSSGNIPIIIDTVKDGDVYTSDLTALEEKIVEFTPEKIVCIVSTTSCFAPRGPDKIVEISEICRKYAIPHVVNNAYGLQESKCIDVISKSMPDLIVQSTDKNLMVPVGGSIITSWNENTISNLSKSYPGRASISPTIDVVCTLLEMGVKGYQDLRTQRKQNFIYLKSCIEDLAHEYHEKVYETKDNRISIAMSLNNFAKNLEKSGKNVSIIGSMIFKKLVSGCRVLYPNNKHIDGYEFINWGQHHSHESICYLTFAATIGQTKDEIDIALGRIHKVLKELSLMSVQHL